jgi:hypothetical protein
MAQDIINQHVYKGHNSLLDPEKLKRFSLQIHCGLGLEIDGHGIVIDGTKEGRAWYDGFSRNDEKLYIVSPL